MQRGGLQAFALQRAGQACATEFAVDEHEGLLQVARLENLVQRAPLVVGPHTVKMLLDGRGRGVGARHFNRHRVLQIAGRQAFDLWRKGGGKKQRDALLGQVAQNALQVRQKADVKHAVGFIKHHIFDLVQHGVFGFDVVEQAARCGHQHFNAALELQRLRLHVHAAKNHRTAQVGVLRIQLDLPGHLDRKFARRQQHQRPHRVARWRR